MNVTYTAVFAAPLVLGILYNHLGFRAVAAVIGILLLCGAVSAGYEGKQ